MKVTSIKVQVKNPERVSVFLDGMYSFSLSLDQLADSRINKEDELSPSDVKKYEKLSADGKLRARALEWLLNRPHSTREFNDYLYRKKADSELSESLITEFTAKKYIDDAAYAKWLVELRSRKGKSNRAIVAELAVKGISREVASEALSESGVNEEDRLRDLIEKKKNNSRYVSEPLKFKQYLVSKGFSYELVNQQLNQCD